MKKWKRIIAGICVITCVVASLTIPEKTLLADETSSSTEVSPSDFNVEDGDYSQKSEVVGDISHLTPITFSDFGFSYTNVTGNSQAIKEYNGSLDGKYFSGEVYFDPGTPSQDYNADLNAQGSRIEYGYDSNNNIAFKIYRDVNNEAGDVIIVKHDAYTPSGYSSQNVVLSPAIAGVDITQPFKLGISLEYLNEDENTSVIEEVKVGIYFNDILYNGEYLIYENVTASHIGSKIKAFTRSTTSTLYLKSIVTPASNLKPLSFSDLGFSNRGMSAGAVNQTSTYSGSLDGTYVSGQVYLQPGSGVEDAYIDYSVNGDSAFRIWRNYNSSNGLGDIIRFKHTAGLTPSSYPAGSLAPNGFIFNFSPIVAGIDVTKPFKLGISSEYKDTNTSDGIVDEVKFGIYFNDVLYDGTYIIYKNVSTNYVSNKVKVYSTSTSILHIQSIVKPSKDLKHLSFGDLGIANTENKVGAVNQTVECIEGLSGTYISGQVYFQPVSDETDSYIDVNYTANNGSFRIWRNPTSANNLGDIIRFKHTAGLKPSSYPVGSLASNGFIFNFDPTVAGIDITKPFQLGISTEYIDSNATDNTVDEVKIGIYFNDVLYNGTHIVYKSVSTSYISNKIKVASIATAILHIHSNNPTTEHLEPISFADFGIASKAPEKVESDYTGATRYHKLDGTFFEGEVFFDQCENSSADSSYMMIGYNDGYGFQICRNKNYTGGDAIRIGHTGAIKAQGYTNSHFIYFDPTIAGVDITQPFKLGISMEYTNKDNDPAVIEMVKMGVFFNGVLYKGAYLIYKDIPVENIGNQLYLYSKANTILGFNTIEKYKTGIGTEWISDKKLVADVVLDKEGEFLQYGTIRVCREENGSISISDQSGAHCFETTYIESVPSFDEEFEIAILPRTASDNQVNINIWINGELQGTEPIIATNYGNKLSKILKVTGAIKNVVLEAQYYDLKNGAYLLTGTDIKVNDKSYSQGESLGIPGVYHITHTLDNTAYSKQVILWKFGCVNEDTEIDIVDLVALKKGTENIDVTESRRKGGDINSDTYLDDSDMNLYREVLSGEKTMDDLATEHAVISLALDKDVMPIGGFYGPLRSFVPGGYTEATTNQITDDVFEKIAYAGINLIPYSEGYYREDTATEIQKSLALGEKYGIGMTVRLPEDSTYWTGEESNYVSLVSELSKYQSFQGFNIYDEPKGDTSGYFLSNDRSSIADISVEAKRANKYTNYYGYVNLLPDYGSLLQQSQYNQYLTEYYNSCDPHFISWDHYVYTNDDKSQYFVNMDKVRTMAQRTQLPFWGFVRTDYDTSKETECCTAQEIKWNINTMLAYGVQGIQYYPLMRPWSENTLTTGSILDKEGNKTNMYDIVQSANKQIAAVDHVLMNSVSKDILAVGTDAQRATSISKTTYKELTTVTANSGAIIGCFAYQGKTALYVVNYSDTAQQSITLGFNKNYSLSLLAAGLDQTVQTANNSYILTLNAGDAVLVIVE